jgi:5'(3')-deoxyribonucleotidase
MNRTLQSTDWVKNPLAFAQYANIVLAGDKGIPSTIEPRDDGGYDVVTDEGAVFRFLPESLAAKL